MEDLTVIDNLCIKYIIDDSAFYAKKKRGLDYKEQEVYRQTEMHPYIKSKLGLVKNTFINGNKQRLFIFLNKIAFINLSTFFYVSL